MIERVEEESDGEGGEESDGEGGELIEWEWRPWPGDKQLVFVKVPQTALRR